MSKIFVDLARITAHSIELIYTSHASWPLPPQFLPRDSNDGRRHTALSVSVLDSSFNPPTLAHAALAQLTVPVSSSSTIGDKQTSSEDYVARMLLFSMKNADKNLKPGDATPPQRLEMMTILARELESIGRQTGNHGLQNVAVAVCHEPTFVGKSTALKAFLHQRILDLESSSASLPAAMDTVTDVQLTFLMGFDTLERFFAPRYYGGSESAMKHALTEFFSSDNSRVLCARRSSGASYTQSETDILDVAVDFVRSGKVMLTDIVESNRTLSSSEIRDSIRNGSTEWETKTLPAIAAYIKEHGLYMCTGVE